MPIPAEIHGQRYISLATFRKTGVPIYTPIWFAEEDDKIYFMTNSKLGKIKRIRNRIDRQHAVSGLPPVPELVFSDECPARIIAHLWP